MFTTNHSLGQSSKFIKQKQEGEGKDQHTSIKESNNSNNIISSWVSNFYSIAIE